MNFDLKSKLSCDVRPKSSARLNCRVLNGVVVKLWEHGYNFYGQIQLQFQFLDFSRNRFSLFSIKIYPLTSLDQHLASFILANIQLSICFFWTLFVLIVFCKVLLFTNFPFSSIGNGFRDLCLGIFVEEPGSTLLH